MSEAIQKFIFANANEVRVVMRNNDPWFIAKDVCEILGTRTDNVRQIVGNKRVMSIDPYIIGVGNHGGRDILLVNEAGLDSLILRSRKPEAKLPQPEEGESHFDMLKRWKKGEMTEYEEIEIVNNLTNQQVIKEA